jgi:hypothetical protein
LSSEEGSDPVLSSPVRGIAVQLVANASLLIALLVYMGWAYDDARYGYFHVNPIDVDTSVIEYMLLSLSLFSPALVIAAMVLITATAVRAWGIDRAKLTHLTASKTVSRILAVAPFRRLVSAVAAAPPHFGRMVTVGAGATVMITALILYWGASRIQISSYLVLGMLGAGPLLLTWPTRSARPGRFPYALATIAAVVCTLWAASLYAHSLGIQAGQQIVRDLPARTAVAVYSAQPLALSGPGVTVQTLSAGYNYHYLYLGLRLLTARSGTYYLLPVHWSPQLDFTYILDGSDPGIRIQFY